MAKKTARRATSKTKPKSTSKPGKQKSLDLLMERIKAATTQSEIDQLEAEVEKLLGKKPPPPEQRNAPQSGPQNAPRNSWNVGTLGDVAAFLGYQLQTVKQWRTGPDPMPGEPGAWPLDEITRWKLRQAGANAASTRTSELIQEEKEVDIERKRLKLAREQGELVEFDAVGRIFGRTIAELQSFGKEIPDRILEALPQNMPAKTKGRILTVVRKAVDTMFDGMAQASETWAKEVLETGADDDSVD